jgi:hypothetical protein
VSKQVGWHRNRGRWIVTGRAWRGARFTGQAVSGMEAT